MSFYIYKLTNTDTNKQFIGISTNPAQRFTDNLAALKSYDLEIIESVDSMEEADEREEFWCNFYKLKPDPVIVDTSDIPEDIPEVDEFYEVNVKPTKRLVQATDIFDLDEPNDEFRYQANSFRKSGASLGYNKKN